jgi:hypothetical protein
MLAGRLLTCYAGGRWKAAESFGDKHQTLGRKGAFLPKTSEKLYLSRTLFFVHFMKNSFSSI